MKIKKGIILSGGVGSRLYPLTIAANKQLLPVYDKPVIYYPLTTLMLAGIQEVLIISTAKDLDAIETLFGSGEQFGMHFHYQVQEHPNGLPEAFILGEQFIDRSPVAMILGDNFFHGHGLPEIIYKPAQEISGAHIFTYHVEDPERYGIVVLNEKQEVLSIEEKPKNPKSNLAITGLYYFDGTVSERAKKLQPSKRGELEIVDLIKSYHDDNQLNLSQLGRGYVWFDVGTPKSLLDASQYVEVIQSRQGIFISSPEEVALHMNYIDQNQFEKILNTLPICKYRNYLSKLIKQ